MFIITAPKRTWNDVVKFHGGVNITRLDQAVTAAMLKVQGYISAGKLRDCHDADSL